MAKLIVFNFTTLNGYYKAPGDDISWHQHGGEESEYSRESLQSGDTLLFGRLTYEVMERFWPTPMGQAFDPIVAERMNNTEKIVFSSSLKKVEWNNSRIIKDNIIEEVKNLKTTSSKDLAVLGSGSVVTQLAEAGLVDEYQILIDPVVLGEGTPMFKGMKKELRLKLTGSRVFKSGIVLLTYAPA